MLKRNTKTDEIIRPIMERLKPEIRKIINESMKTKSVRKTLDEYAGAVNASDVKSPRRVSSKRINENIRNARPVNEKTEWSKEPLIERMRAFVSWSNHLSEDFNYKLKDAEATVKLMGNTIYDVIDDLYGVLYDDEDWKSYLHDAKMVNKAIGEEYYKTDKKEVIEIIRNRFDEDFDLK